MPRSSLKEESRSIGIYETHISYRFRPVRRASVESCLICAGELTSLPHIRKGVIDPVPSHHSTPDPAGQNSPLHSRFWRHFPDRGPQAEKERHSMIVSLTIVGSVAIVIFLMSITIMIGRAPHLSLHSTHDSTTSIATPSITSSPSFASPSPTAESFEPKPIITGIPQIGAPLPAPSPSPTVTESKEERGREGFATSYQGRPVWCYRSDDCYYDD